MLQRVLSSIVTTHPLLRNTERGKDVMEKLTPHQRNGRMWADLLISELRWKAGREEVTMRARLYIDAGLPPGQVLDALKISPAEWDHRLQEMEAARARRAADYTGTAKTRALESAAETAQRLGLKEPGDGQ
jgi:hypothetical protein